MNFANMDYSQVIFIVIGIACVVRGIITITTGKIPGSELARLNGYSENGLRKYKVLSSVINIVGGLLCVGISVVKLFGIFESVTYKIIVFAILIVMIVVYVLLRNACKKAQ